jgi:cytoskeletal protein RodZ
MSFGEKLRRERERQGLELADIAIATKIGTRHLQSIEDEDLSRLPGGVFNRGFVRAYARHLGMQDEEKELIADMDALSESKKPDARAAAAGARTSDSKSDTAPRGILRWISPLL